jgi:hypothetical protein
VRDRLPLASKIQYVYRTKVIVDFYVRSNRSNRRKQEIATMTLKQNSVLLQSCLTLFLPLCTLSCSATPLWHSMLAISAIMYTGTYYSRVCKFGWMTLLICRRQKLCLFRLEKLTTSLFLSFMPQTQKCKKGEPLGIKQWQKTTRRMAQALTIKYS